MIDGWKTYKLKELSSKIGSGATPRGGNEAYKSEGISLIRSQNILDFIFSTNGLAFIDEDQAAKLNNVEVQSRDVLLNITGDSVARVCQVPDELLPARVNQHVAIIRANQKLLNPDFLKYTLLSPNKKEYLLILASAGATRNAITKSMIEDFEISIPPIPQQTAIASILSALDDKIELNLQQNKTLEEMAMALYNHWFVDFGPFKEGEFVESELGRIPEGWEVKTFGEICTVINGRAYKNDEFLDSGTPIIRIQNLNGGGKTVYSDLNLDANKYVISGDLLYAWSATFGPYIWDGPLSIYHYHIWKIVVDNSIMGKYYLYHHLLRVSDQMKEHGTGSIFTHLTKASMESQKIIIPKNETLDSIEAKLSLLHEKILLNKDEIEILKQKRDSLLAKLISGEILVKDLKNNLKEVL
jgi:type I restriction enzyme S subunit